MKHERSKEKERKKRGWYRNLGGQTDDFTVFCPMSSRRKAGHQVERSDGGGEEEQWGRVRGYLVEQSGIPLSALLYPSQPGEANECGKADCNPCRKGTTLQEGG